MKRGHKKENQQRKGSPENSRNSHLYASALKEFRKQHIRKRHLPGWAGLESDFENVQKKTGNTEKSGGFSRSSKKYHCISFQPLLFPNELEAHEYY